MQTIREQVTKRYENQGEFLTNMISQRQSKVDDHHAGRHLLADEELAQHERHIAGFRRKLEAHKRKDPAMVKLEIEAEIELQEKMMRGEFSWTPGSDELVLKEDP